MRIKLSTMSRAARAVLAVALAVVTILLAEPAVAQVPKAGTSSQPAPASGDATPELTLAEVEAALVAIEADTKIEDAVKNLLRKKYKRAVEALKEAAGFAAKAADYREAIKTAPQQAAQLRQQQKALPSVENGAKVTATGSTEDYQKHLDSRQAACNKAKEDLSKTTSELSRIKARPVEISARLPQVQRELSDIREQLVSPKLAHDATSPGRVADRLVLQAEQARLLNESEMLRQEQLSLSVREDLLQAQQELLTRQLENAAAALSALEALLHQRLTSEAKQVSSLADTLPQDVPANDEAAQALAAELRSFARQFEDVLEDSEKVEAAQKSVKNRLKGLEDAYQAIQEQMELGGGGRAIVQVLFNLRSLARYTRADMHAVPLPELDEIRLDALQLAEGLRKQPEVERQFANRSSGAVAQLVATRRQVLERLRAQYGHLIRARAAMEGDKREYVDKAQEVRHYVSRQLFGFGIRSCPPISGKTLAGIPGGLRWLFGSDHWADLGRALQWTATRMPVRTMGIFLTVVVILFMRRRIGVALERTGERTRRISTDRYAHTIEALVWTCLLAVPLPVTIGFAGWAFGQTPKPSDWMPGLAYGLRIAASVTLATQLMAALCRPGGLAAAHFGWCEETLARFRRAIHQFVIVYVPALLLTFSCAFGDESRHIGSVGRISFLLAHVWLAIVLWQLFCSQDGILVTLAREHPERLMTRWRFVWLPLLLACPLALVIVASLGYLIPATQLSLGLIATIVQVAGAAIFCALTLRWLMLKQRKLALAEALQRRRARQQAAASQDRQEASGEVVSVDLDDQQEKSLDSITEQTRALLRLLFSLGAVVAIISFWSRTFPIIEVMDSIVIPLLGGLTLLGLAQATLVAAFTYIAVRSLPGLLELAVLRATTIDPGTRHAICTLLQYAVTALGLTLLLNVLQVDWTKFGWVAAALSVGLGFGLQEIVANFVCGLILLLERPLRVGDVVTVEGVTGTVTKIHMRATTITNWDRQELVVPNKSLITNTLLNWTLSTPVNRIVVPVGVAYGSDIDKALQILLDVAADHPRVLDEPAPMASFEQFADSSLNLFLRAYLPDLDTRLGTITELHRAIDKRFAAAGIEIAFPQQDLHLRSGWGHAGGVGSDESEGRQR